MELSSPAAEAHAGKWAVTEHRRRAHLDCMQRDRERERRGGRRPGPTHLTAAAPKRNRSRFGSREAVGHQSPVAAWGTRYPTADEAGRPRCRPRRLLERCPSEEQRSHRAKTCAQHCSQARLRSRPPQSATRTHRATAGQRAPSPSHRPPMRADRRASIDRDANYTVRFIVWEINT